MDLNNSAYLERRRNALADYARAYAGCDPSFIAPPFSSADHSMKPKPAFQRKPHVQRNR
jgi:hypothetical protein